MKTARLLCTFYGNYALASAIVTLSCLWMYYQYQLNSFFLMFLFKWLTLGVTVAFVHSYKSNEFYYYRNLGLTVPVLWAGTISFDLVIFLMAHITLHQLI